MDHWELTKRADQKSELKRERAQGISGRSAQVAYRRVTQISDK